MSGTVSPLDAYIASQPTQPWIGRRWSPAMFDWLHEILPTSQNKETFFRRVWEKCARQVGQTQAEYRLASLPDMRDVISLMTGEAEPDYFHWSKELVRWDDAILCQPAWRLLPLNAEEVEAVGEEIIGFWGPVSNIHPIFGLFDHPNANPDWLDGWGQKILSMPSGSTRKAGLEALACNPSISPELAFKIAEDEEVRNFNAFRAILFNPAFTHEMFQATENPRTVGSRVFDVLGHQMAVAVGFEPTVGLTPHIISSDAPSAARTRHREVPYRTGHDSRKPGPSRSPSLTDALSVTFGSPNSRYPGRNVNLTAWWTSQSPGSPTSNSAIASARVR